MNRIPTTTARAALAVVLLGSLLLQTLVPGVASEMARGAAEVAHLVLPYSAAAIVALACLQCALLGVWWLLVLVSRDEIFTPRSLHVTGAVTVLAAVATVVAAGPMVHLLAVVGVGGPGVLLALAACVACGGTAVLLGAVVRRVLDEAVANRRAVDRVESGTAIAPGRPSRP